MAINIFEGGRRIRTLLAALWMLGIGLMAWHTEPYSHLYIQMSPWTEQRIIDGCGSSDSTKYLSSLPLGKDTVSITLCFKAYPVADGVMAIPYAKDKDGHWLADLSYTSHVRDYIEEAARSFSLLPEHVKAAKEKLDAAKAENRKLLSIYFFAGLAVIYGVAAVIGWVIRGFANIPAGMDNKPN